ncbi:hypothetical protein H2204_009232 [Knufia peltigerae]|uniref:Dihydrofolate reductase n=1 Tax=Knufia peltigerae TaxID=1002370 RepID=A0AA38XYE5_9EURO|nr:hypothetical protein H2204_009232 [Knufia peltigerae]
MTTIPTPPSTTLSGPPSPTERHITVSFVDPFDGTVPDDDDDDMSATKRIIKTTTTTITPIRIHPKPIYLIVATSLNPPMGIGNNGDLPWPPIKADMAFFRKVTSQVSPPTEQASSSRMFNAVVMGRKTWESIPPKFRPLSGRLNVIITRGKSSDLGSRIIEDLKSSNDGAAWSLHEFATRSKPSKSKTSSKNSTSAILTPPPSAPSQAAPILISPSLQSILTLLSNPSAVADPTSTSKPATSGPPPSLTVNKIFCIGGAEIYRQILSMSSAYTDRYPLQKRSTNQIDSETDTDTDGEGDSTDFDVRILQTQVRKVVPPPPPPDSSSPSSPATLSRQHTSSEPDFECDTFFPDLLPADPGIKSAKWKPLPAEWLDEWVDGIELPQARQTSTRADSNAGGGWYRDEKTDIEIRVVGWERRGARSDSVISLPRDFRP